MKKTIGFVTSGLKINGDSVRQTGIGGSESALIYMAQELTKLGNQVTVYCELAGEPANYHGVAYKDINDYGKNGIDQFDVLIISRFSEYFDFVLDSKLNIFWAHDTSSLYMPHVLGVADKIFVLSDYHKSLYVNEYKIKKESIIQVTSNGFDDSIIPAPVDFEQKKNNFVYASRPERGLKFLLTDIWPKVVEKNPQATLHICGYNVDASRIPEEFHALYEEVDQLIQDGKNIKNLGPLNKKDYYALLSTCAYMLYPTDFAEISCINAMEAQANECLIITSDRYALSETVKTNSLVSEPYELDSYVEKFLGMIEHYQGDVYRQEVTKGRKAIAEYAWPNVAKSWNSIMDNFFQDRHAANKERILENLVYHSDLVAAWQLTQDNQYRQYLDQSAGDNVNDKNVGPFATTPIERAQDLHKLIKQRINQHPDKKLNVLDLGCHNGVLSVPLSNEFAQHINQMVMFDSNTDALNQIKEYVGEQNTQIDYVVDNLRNLKNYDFQPDVVIVGEILEHIEDTKSFLDSVLNLAQENTLFYFTVPRGPWEMGFGWHMEKLHHVHHFEKSDLEQLFQNVNLTFGNGGGKINSLRGNLLDNWVFWFELSKGHNTQIGTINYQEKFIKTRPYQRITCGLLVKNAEKTITNCLASIKNCFDEIVVVDAGSTDDTKNIASQYTKNIYDWHESIDSVEGLVKAKNYALGRCTGDYVFWLEADELINQLERVFKFINNGYYDSVMLPCKNKSGHDVVQGRVFKSGLQIIKHGSNYHLSYNGQDIVGDPLVLSSTTVIR